MHHPQCNTLPVPVWPFFAPFSNVCNSVRLVLTKKWRKTSVEWWMGTRNACRGCPTFRSCHTDVRWWGKTTHRTRFFSSTCSVTTRSQYSSWRTWACVGVRCSVTLAVEIWRGPHIASVNITSRTGACSAGKSWWRGADTDKDQMDFRLSVFLKLWGRTKVRCVLRYLYNYNSSFISFPFNQIFIFTDMYSVTFVIGCNKYEHATVVC